MKLHDEITQLIFSALLALNPKATVKDLANYLNDSRELGL